MSQPRPDGDDAARPSSRPAYVPLHVHSDYSVRDGLESVEAIVARARELGLPALALTDWTNVCGYVKFYRACLRAGIKPLLGADVEVDGGGGAQQRFRLTLLAMDASGRQQLYDLLSRAWLRIDPREGSPYTTGDDLARHAQGLMVLCGFRSDVAALIRRRDGEGLQRRLDFYQRHFADRFCLELTRTGREGEAEFEAAALELCMSRGICPVATNDTVFLYGPQQAGEDGFSDYDIHDVRVAIGRGVPRHDPEVARTYSAQQYLRSAREMEELFADVPEALDNTRAVAERCNVELMLDVPCLPHYDTGELSAPDFLSRTARSGLEERLAFLFPDPEERARQQPRYASRLEEELEVICSMDFAGYFLIVMEFIRWSKEHGVPVGPGRGSGGGSLVAYALGITDLDPIRFDLLFERFLNKERVSMPDFDIDFCQRNREKTLEHVRERYGAEAVAQIATFGTLAPKAAVRAAGRALSLPYGLVDSIAARLPGRPGLTFQDVFTADEQQSAAPDFLRLYRQARLDDDRNDEQAKIVDLINIARRLEGVIWSFGKHAAGVVIAPTRTAEFTPLMVDRDGNTVTQFDKKDVEHAGLIKFDFLGLTTLTIIDDALRMINAGCGAGGVRAGQGPLRLEDIPLEDEASYEVIQRGDTTAVFQLESQGMRSLILQMKPDCFDDLIALVALYRPGPMKSGMVQHFVDRKQGREPVHYPQPDFEDPDLRPILEPTYGVIVYQEQVMQIAQVLAGYSLGGADILRRAMGKKIASEMAAQRSVFGEGARRLGRDSGIALRIFDQIETFAEYGFNKSHSAAYALIAWWTLYLKAHYPAQFLAAMMTADRDRTEKLIDYIDNCRRLGIRVLPPDVTVGGYDFGVNEHGEVVFGLGAIKGIGADLAHRIAEERTAAPFADLFDFAERTAECLNRRSLEALVYSGALDRLGPDRAALYDSIDTALKYAGQHSRDVQAGSSDLFAPLSSAARPSFVRRRRWSLRTRLWHERQVLGMYMSGHPITEYGPELRYFCPAAIAAATAGTREHPSEAMLSGLVSGHEEKTSRNGSRFHVLTLDDGTAQLELSVFSAPAQHLGEILRMHEGHQGGARPADSPPAPLVVIVRGQLYRGEEDGRLRMRVRELFTLEEKRLELARGITVRLSGSELEPLRRHLGQAAQAAARTAGAAAPPPDGPADESAPASADGAPGPGGCALNLQIGSIMVRVGDDGHSFRPTDDFLCTLREIAGEQAVTISYR